MYQFALALLLGAAIGIVVYDLGSRAYSHSYSPPSWEERQRQRERELWRKREEEEWKRKEEERKREEEERKRKEEERKRKEAHDLKVQKSRELDKFDDAFDSFQDD